MDLKDFVRDAIMDVLGGVHEAQQKATTIPDSEVSPPQRAVGDGSAISERPLTWLDFDVAVTASEGKGSKGGIAVAVASIGLGASRDQRTEEASTSRLRFKVPIVLPTKGQRPAPTPMLEPPPILRDPF